MTSSTAATRRLVLVPAAPRGDRSDAVVRRYRLALRRLEARDEPQADRPRHFKRAD